eukprot:sb/3473612/
MFLVYQLSHRAQNLVLKYPIFPLLSKAPPEYDRSQGRILEVRPFPSFFQVLFNYDIRLQEIKSGFFDMFLVYQLSHRAQNLHQTNKMSSEKCDGIVELSLPRLSGFTFGSKEPQYELDPSVPARYVDLLKTDNKLSYWFEITINGIYW